MRSKFVQDLDNLHLILFYSIPISQNVKLAKKPKFANVSQKVGSIFRCLYRFKHFLPAKIKEMLVHILIFPLIDYGAVCYFDSNADQLFTSYMSKTFPQSIENNFFPFCTLLLPRHTHLPAFNSFVLLMTKIFAESIATFYENSQYSIHYFVPA